MVTFKKYFTLYKVLNLLTFKFVKFTLAEAFLLFFLRAFYLKIGETLLSDFLNLILDFNIMLAFEFYFVINDYGID